MWNNFNEVKPKTKGLYWVQTREGLCHLEVNYTSSYWNGWKWYGCQPRSVYYWQVIEQAPEPGGTSYVDGMDRLPCVSASELVGDLTQDSLGKG